MGKKSGMVFPVEFADCLTGSRDYHARVGFGDSELYSYFIEFPTIVVSAVEDIAVPFGEPGIYEALDLSDTFGLVFVVFVGCWMEVKGIDIGFGMRLPSAVTINVDIAGGHCQESFGLTLRGEICTTEPKTAECFLQCVFIAVGASCH